MQTTILLDHDIEGHAKYLQAGLRETGWDQDLTIEFRRLRDLGLPDDSSDAAFWRISSKMRLSQPGRAVSGRFLQTNHIDEAGRAPPAVLFGISVSIGQLVITT